MGVYATTTAISELLPGYLVGNTTASDTVGTNIFSRHIDRAEGYINSKITAQYDPSGWIVGTTTTNVPPFIRKLAEDIACYYAIRGTSTQDGQIRNENLAEFREAFDDLEQITEGKLKLAYTDGSLVSTRSSSRFLSSSENYTPIFGLDDETDWAVDSDALDDLSDARS